MMLRWTTLVAVVLVMLATTASAQTTTSLLHPMFQDHAVLQRDRPIPVYGHASAHARIDLAFAGHRVQATANATGEWRAALPPMPAGGPYALEASSGDATQRIDDILIGDVWLCSGQSNMVLQLHRSLDARAEIQNANNDRIRMLTVGETGSVTPLATFATPVQWKPTSPQVATDFSATCFYFARELQKRVDVPMGLVVAAWGGSRIEAWASAQALRARDDLDAELDVLERYARDTADGTAAWGEHWAQWWRKQNRGDAPWQRGDVDGDEWSDAPAGLGAWERWNVPALAQYDGMVWYRTHATLTRAQATQAATLELAAIDEVDMTWVNGRAVGSEYAPGRPRTYPLPRGLLRAGDNTVAINALDTYRDGGLAGPAEASALRFADGSRVPLDRGWRWRLARGDWPPRAPWHTAAGLSTLYNGMIAPIGRYGFRGVLWYQGESNTGEATRYASLLASLIGDWRARFDDAALPWLNVQLAGYGAAPTQPSESGWAELREVQRRYGERDPHYGVATAVDLGDRYDIHPPNKQELGRRLARLARHLVYGERALVPSGPQPASVRRERDEIVVRFDQVEQALVAYGADAPIGFELCRAGDDAAARPASSASSATPLACRYAPARLDGNTVRLRDDPSRPATRVRHAWADSPVITLFDRNGLPAQPFDLPVESSASPN